MTDQAALPSQRQFWASSALIAGTTVGAGVLALPAVTLPVGVIPSTLLMISVWLYMAVSGLLIAEANLQATARSHHSQIKHKTVDCTAHSATTKDQPHNASSMPPSLGLLGTVKVHLGTTGAVVTGIAYIFIHYALLVAYIARGGDILAEALNSILHNIIVRWDSAASLSVSLAGGHALFAGLIGGVLLIGSDRTIARLNNLLVALVVLSFSGLLVLTVARVNPSLWQVQHWSAVSFAVPAMVVAFVYHNVVPVVAAQLQGDRRQIRRAILLGSLLPLVMFAVWNAVILGSLGSMPPAVVGDVLDPIEMLRMGKAHPQLGTMVSVFSEFAIATSFIGFVIGLQDVYSDLLPFTRSKSLWQLFIYGLILLPPLALSVLSPSIFFQAIDLAGAFGNSVLFGIIPAVMVWRSRYHSTQESASELPLVAGGRSLLLLMIVMAAAVIIQNLLIKIGQLPR